LENRNTYLVQGSVWKGIVRFAIPILLSNLFQQLYNTVDTAVVGKFAGSEALAAVGSTGALINLFVGFFLGISTGTGVIFATAYGARDIEKLKKVLHAALILAFGAGAVLTAVGTTCARGMLELMDSPADVIELASEYMQIYFAGSLFMLIYNVGAGIIQSSGDSRRPLIYLVISGVLNVICDVFCVAVLDMGAAGAAVATVFSQLIACALILIRLYRIPEGWRLRLRELRFDKRVAWNITKLAVPSGLQSCMFSLSNILIQAKINAFGSVAMAGVAAYSRIDGFGFMPIQALGLSISTFVSQNLGAGQYQRIRQGVKVVVLCACLSSLTVNSCICLFGRKLLRIFTDDPEVISYGMMQLWRLAPFEIIFAFSDVFAGAVRGAGKVTQPMIIYAITICAFRIVGLLILMPLIPDIRVVFWAYPTSWTICSAALTIYYSKGSWMPEGMRKKLAAQSK